MKVPEGYCQCGCDNLAPISPYTNKKIGYIKGKPRRFISGHNSKVFPPHWSGGRRITSGYAEIRIPSHPMARRNGYVPEHRLIASKAFGKSLPVGCVIHHPNGRTDNDVLVICQDTAYHFLIETRQRAYEATGDPHKRKCIYCYRWDDISGMDKHNQVGRITRFFHNECRKKYRKEYKERMVKSRHGK